jgi:hypothetical protein
MPDRMRTIAAFVSGSAWLAFTGVHERSYVERLGRAQSLGDHSVHTAIRTAMPAQSESLNQIVYAVEEYLPQVMRFGMAKRKTAFQEFHEGRWP